MIRKLGPNLAQVTPTGEEQSMRGKLKRAGMADGFFLKLIRFAKT